ncbi:hypothetical protein B0H15DRAFT_859836 [Mycena belliarum]|uniref:Uncharacterized protein n=1 Tax=Mycena belliarum TaxID=1033014 RepID=A0AAD6TTG9_9AGAR|nr:hypothetical protein B0H15DRAFT_859836 [Mycena belliae]
MLRTATRLARRPRNAPAAVLSRPSSSAAHVQDDHHDHHEQDDTVYPREGFTGPIWRKTLVCTVGAVLFYECLGAPLDNTLPWVPLSDVAGPTSWLDIASTRAAKEKAVLEGRQLVRSAERPPIYRSRNPEEFNQISPFGNAVGMDVRWGKPSAGTGTVPDMGTILSNARK